MLKKLKEFLQWLLEETDEEQHERIDRDHCG